MNTSPFPPTKQEIEAKKVLGAIPRQIGLEPNVAAIEELITPYLAGTTKTLAPLCATLIWNRISMTQLFPWETERKIAAGLVHDALMQISAMVENQMVLVKG